MRRLLLTDPENRIKKRDGRAVQTVHCVPAALLSILSATCASTSPRSSGRKLKLIWPKNAINFRSCCAKSNDNERRALFCLLMMTTSNRKRQVICALTLSLSLTISLPRFWYSSYSQKVLCGARQCEWTAAGQGCRCIINVIRCCCCCCW